MKKQKYLAMVGYLILLVATTGCDRNRSSHQTKEISDSELVAGKNGGTTLALVQQEKCDSLLAKLIYSSNFKSNLIYEGNSRKLIFTIDRFEGHKAHILVSQKNSEGNEVAVAQLEFDAQANTLRDISVDMNNRISLQFDQKLGTLLMSTCQKFQ